MDEGREAIDDESERRQVRRQAWVVMGKAVALAGVLTALTLLPG